MKFSLALPLALALVAAPPALAQNTASGAAQTKQPSDVSQPIARDSVTVALDAKSTAELKKTLEELALTLDRLAQRVAEDPELRASAVRAASSFVGLAQILVAQQALVLQGVLDSAAERLSQTVPPPTH